MPKKKIMIIGLGRFGTTLVESLAESDVELLVFDSDKNKINAIKNLVLNAVCIDATQEETLSRFDIEDFEAVVVTMGEKFESNLLTTVFLKKLGAKKVIARASTAVEEMIFRQVGADIVVFPEVEMGRKLANTLLRQRVEESIPLSDGHSIVNIRVTETLIGKSIQELDLRRAFQINVFAVKRSGESQEQTIIPGPEYIIQNEDTLMIVGKNTDIDRFVKNI